MTAREQLATQALLKLTADTCDPHQDRGCALQLVAYVAGLEQGAAAHTADELTELTLSYAGRGLISMPSATALNAYLKEAR